MYLKKYFIETSFIPISLKKCFLLRSLEQYFDERLFGEFALFKSGESTGMEIFSNLVAITYQLNFDRSGQLKQSGSGSSR